jgi:hypothetical protein
LIIHAAIVRRAAGEDAAIGGFIEFASRRDCIGEIIFFYAYHRHVFAGFAEKSTRLWA